MARILSIEDDASLQHLISAALNAEGYEVHYAFTGKEGYQKVFGLDPDLVVLDLMLPGMNGVDIIKAMQAHPDLRNIPILVMTAYGGKTDVLERSLKALGAVEYLEKPFHVRDLIRRVKLCLARFPKPATPGREIRSGDVRLDTRLKTVRIHDRLVTTLPDKRFELLAALIQAEGALTKDKLLERVWGREGSLAALEKTISRLREDLGPHAFRLRTAAGGYEFVSRADAI